jgi:hypothetical protein
MSRGEARDWANNDPEDVRRAVRRTYPRGYVRIVHPTRGNALVEVLQDPGYAPPAKPKRQPPKPPNKDTFEARTNEAINWLTAAQSAERKGDMAEAKRCVSAARDEIHQAEMTMVERAE